MNDPFATFIAQADTMRFVPTSKKHPWEAQAVVRTLAWMRKQGKPVTALEVAEAMGVSRMAAKERLVVLRKGDLVVYEAQKGKRTRANPGVWKLTEKGRG